VGGPARPGPARLRVVILLASVLALDSADKATIGATAVQPEQALHIGNTQVGLLVTVSTGVGALATLPVGVLIDRINRTKLLSGAIVVWSAAMLLSGASTSFLMLLLTRLALGAAAAPAVASLTGDLFPAAERGRIYGYILTGELVGTGIGFLVSSDVAAVLSWRYSFWVLAVPGFVLAAAIWRLLPEPRPGRPEPPATRRTGHPHRRASRTRPRHRGRSGETGSRSGRTGGGRAERRAARGACPAHPGHVRCGGRCATSCRSTPTWC